MSTPAIAHAPRTVPGLTAALLVSSAVVTLMLVAFLAGPLAVQVLAATVGSIFACNLAVNAYRFFMLVGDPGE